jgi:hypothetical protein
MFFWTSVDKPRIFSTKELFFLYMLPLKHVKLWTGPACPGLLLKIFKIKIPGLWAASLFSPMFQLHVVSQHCKVQCKEEQIRLATDSSFSQINIDNTYLGMQQCKQSHVGAHTCDYSRYVSCYTHLDTSLPCWCSSLESSHYKPGQVTTTQSWTS